MPSPVGHSLAGLCVYLVARNRFPAGQQSRFVIGSIAVAILPDLDLIPVFLFDDAKSFHRQWTHSLAAAAAFGLLIGALARWWSADGVFYGLWSGAVYVSHVLLDFLLDDPTPPYGIQLLWPFSQSYFMSPIAPFRGFTYGGPDLGVITMFFVPDNLATMAREVVLMTPWVLAAAYGGRRLWRKH